MDFYKIIVERSVDARAKQDYTIYPDFIYKRTTDLIVKGGEFYAFWTGQQWSMDIDDLIDLIDKECWAEYDKLKASDDSLRINVKSMNFESSGLMTRFVNYCKKQKSSNVQFNTEVLFANHEVKKEDYSTYKLTYNPTKGDTSAFDEMMSTLYEEKELDKILWSIGALFTGEIAKIEKFLYLYGPKGTGKGTVLNIIKAMVGEYWKPIDLQYLTSNNEFATSNIEEVPMLIDADTDLSAIKKETNLLKLTSHEEIIKRKLYQTGYPITFKGLLITASNERYKLKSKDSGMVRRPIVVHPTGNKVSFEQYHTLKNQINFEIPAIAQKCIDRFTEMGASYYENEVDVDMITYSDKIFDFIRENHYSIKDGVTLKRAAQMYQEYLTDMGWDGKGAKREIKAALPKYFNTYKKDTKNENGDRVYDWYTDFKYEVAFPEDSSKPIVKEKQYEPIAFKKLEANKQSMFDIEGMNWPAQYANEEGLPMRKWINVPTQLKDIDPTELHYVLVPQNHIVLDFDVKDPKTGEKSLEYNLALASVYPKTYSELSKSGQGIHLHYYYDGDVSKLATHIDTDIEIKVYSGNMSLRRKLTECNEEEIAHISSGLPFKEGKTNMFKDIENITWNDKTLKAFVDAALAKEHHGATKPEMDFLHKVFNEAKEEGVQYDLSAYYNQILKFAMSSTHQREYCVNLLSDIPLSTIKKEEELPAAEKSKSLVIDKEELVFWDVETFMNLFLVCWKYYNFKMPENYWKKDLSESEKIVRQAFDDLYKDKMFGIWYNPKPEQLGTLLEKPLVGYNNRKYDNHILYNAYLGATNMELYQQSQGIINGNMNAMMQPAYNLSYADLYEFLDKKQSLKKWEIELGLKHNEFEFPWDQPLAQDKWEFCAEYCMDDVDATDMTFQSESGQASYLARIILSEITELPMNTKTQTLAEKFLFGDDPRPQDKFVWYDLAEEFPGYTFSYGKSDYLGENPSEGGYVYSEPGVYENVMLADVESLHPHSLIAINYFGPYTPKFAALVECRMHIKHGELELAAHAFDDIDPELSDKLRPYLQDPEMASGLGHAMKIVINIVYGMTSAKYDNKFKAPANVDNIVAKRGALFMMMVKRELEAMGQRVIHVKTDSFKLPGAGQEIFDYLQERAHAFGYNFDWEATYSRLALVNKAVIIGQYEYPEKKRGQWSPIGAQFAMPYVLKKLFTGDDVKEEDFAIFKSAKSSIYLGDRFIGKNANVYASVTGEDMFRTGEVDVAKKVQTRWNKGMDPEKIAKEVALSLDDVLRIAENGFKPEMQTTMNSVTGTKGYGWKLWSDYSGVDDIDVGYYDGLVKDAVDSIYKVGDGNIIFGGTKWERSEEVPPAELTTIKFDSNMMNPAVGALPF